MAGGIPVGVRRQHDPSGLPPGFTDPAAPVSRPVPPPLPAPTRPVEAPLPADVRGAAPPAREAPAPTPRRARKGFAPLPRAGGVRWKSTAVYAVVVAVWWPAMWKLGMPMQWAAAGLAALTGALGSLQVTDTIRPSGLGKAEEG